MDGDDLVGGLVGRPAVVLIQVAGIVGQVEDPASSLIRNHPTKGLEQAPRLQVEHPFVFQLLLHRQPDLLKQDNNIRGVGFEIFHHFVCEFLIRNAPFPLFLGVGADLLEVFLLVQQHPLFVFGPHLLDCWELADVVVSA